MDHRQSIREHLVNLNFFDSNSSDEHCKRNEILSTRIHIVVLLSIVVLFALYVAFSSQTTTTTIKGPTSTQFAQLKMKYSNKLQCPCKHISIPYQQFLQLVPQYNEICSSSFVDQKWIEYLFDEKSSSYFPLDFRRSASAKFQSLQALCRNARLIVNDSLNQFYSTEFFSNELISPVVFTAQTDSFIRSFKATTSSFFGNLLKTIRRTVLSNELFSAVDTHFALQLRYTNRWFFHMEQIHYYEEYAQGKYFDCYCDNASICQLPEGIYPHNDMDDSMARNEINATFSVPGMSVSCKPVESLLRSTSECLAERSCLDRIGSYLNSSSMPIGLFLALNRSQTNAKTIEMLANRLFIDDWGVTRSYQAYFDFCQPSLCQFSDEQRYDLVYILTAVITLYGGLRGIIAYFIPVIVAYVRKKRNASQASSNDKSSSEPARIRLSERCHRAASSIAKLNIFNSYSSDVHEQRNEVIASKLYLLLLAICLVGFGASVAMESQSKTVFIYSPTRAQFEELKNRSASDLQCPCNRITNRYLRFLRLSPTYHQLCSSVFVSNLWNNAYDIWNVPNSCHYPSFADITSLYFSFLTAFCQLANETINDGLTAIYAMEYVTSEVVLENQFIHEMLVFIRTFQDRIQKSFLGQLSLIQSTIFTNQIISAKGTNVDFNGTPPAAPVAVTSSLTTHTNCTCGIDASCRQRIGFCSSQQWSFLRGLYIGCFMVDSVLSSSTECFFDPDCVQTMRNYIRPSSRLYAQLKALNASQTSAYATNETIAKLVENLFVETWNESYSYTNYYNECAPSYCSYAVQDHASFLYVLAKLIGLYGGLTFLLGLAVPNFVVMIRRRKSDHASHSSFVHRLAEHLSSVKSKLVGLNLFESSATDRNTARQELITTRLYIVVFLLTLLTLVLYTSVFEHKSIYVTVSLTSPSQLDDLQKAYPNTLACPCNDIAITYDEFLELHPIRHEICASDFITRQWIEYLYDWRRINDRTYGATASAQFQALAVLCRLTEAMVNVSLVQLYSTTLISTELLSSTSFASRMNTTVTIFHMFISHKFHQPFTLIRSLIQSNLFMSAYQTNWQFIVPTLNSSQTVLSTAPRVYNHSCTCATSSRCVESARVNNVTIDGFLIGCYPMEAMLQSSLACLYDQSCLQLILAEFGHPPQQITFQPLTSIDNRNLAETVEQMVKRLFIERWIVNQSYENYYQKCRPSVCTYSYIQTFNLFYIITTIIGLYDGLTVTFRFLVPLIIYAICRAFSPRKTNVIVALTK